MTTFTAHAVHSGLRVTGSAQARRVSRFVAHVPGTPLRLTGGARARVSSHISARPGANTLILTRSARARLTTANLFRRFSHYGISAVDPALALTPSQVSGVAAYDSTAPSFFRRVSAQILAPVEVNASDVRLWDRAAFVGVGVRVNGMAAGNSVFVDGAQVELSKNGAAVPAPYSPARGLNVSVRPDRLNAMANPSMQTTSATTTVRTNRVPNPNYRTKGSNGAVRRNYMTTPSFAGGLGNWRSSATSLTNTATLSTDASWSVSGTGTSMKVQTDGTAPLQGPNISLTALGANVKYTVSATIKNTSGLGVQLATRDTTNNVSGTVSTVVAPGTTARVSSVITMGATASPALLVGVTTVASTGTATTFNVDQIMVEATDVVGPYFDGTTPTDAATGWAYAWLGTAWNSVSDWVAPSASGNITPYAYGNNKGGITTSGVLHVYQTQSSNGGLFAYHSGTEITAAAGEFWAGRYQIRQVGGSGPVTVSPRIGTYASTGAFVGITTQGSNLTLTNDGVWYDAILPSSVVAGAGSVAASMSAYAAGSATPAGTRIEIRNAVLDKVPATGLSIGGYFDGSSPATSTGLSYAWTGTPDASTSVETGKGLVALSGDAPVWQGETDGLGGNFARVKNASYVAGSAFSGPAGAYWAASMVIVGAPGTLVRPRVYDGGTQILTANDAAGLDTTGSLAIPASGRLAVSLYSHLPNTGTVARLYVYVSGGAEVGVGHVVMEQVSGPGRTAGPYFDGGSGPDYLWQQGISGQNGASFFYEDYAARSYLLKQVLAENVALGVTPAVPQFAVLPRY